MIQFSLKSVHIWKSYSKKTKGSRFYGTRCTFSQGYVMLEGTWDLDIPKCWMCSVQSYPKLRTAFTRMLPVLLG